MGINTLHDLYYRKGKDFIERLLNMTVTVNEDLCASMFAFEKFPDGEIKFYKRSGSVEITKIDRVLMRYYEDAIRFVIEFDRKNPEIIPVNWRFGTQYFISNQPVRIIYDRMPKNQMVLSFIHVKNLDNQILRSISKKGDLDKWADVLDIERPPIIYQGKLSDYQKSRILEFVYTPTENLKAQYGTESFTKHILGILKPKLRSSLLQNNLDKNIEGIVFRFGDGDSVDNSDVVLAKIVDPMAHVLTKQNPQSDISKRPSDMFFLTLLDINDYMQTVNFNKIKLRKGSVDDRYVQFICQVFNLFISDRGYRYIDVDFDAPEFIKSNNNKNKFEVNVELIKNEETKNIIQQDVAFEDLFKIFLSAFRRKRKKEVSFFTKDVLMYFNDMVDKIQIFVGKSQIKSVVAEGFIGFTAFVNQYGFVDSDIEIDDDIWNSFDYVIEEEAVDTKKDKDDNGDIGDSDANDNGGNVSGDVSDGEENDDSDGNDSDNSGDIQDSGDSDTKDVEDSDSDEQGANGTTEKNEVLASEENSKKPDPMRILTFWNKTFDMTRIETPNDTIDDDSIDADKHGQKKSNTKTKKNDVNKVSEFEFVGVFVGNFQLLNAGDFQNIKDICDTKNIRTIIIDVNNGERSKDFPLSATLTNSIMLKMMQDNPKYIASYKRIPRALLSDIISVLKDNYIISFIAVLDKYVSGFQKQLEYAVDHMIQVECISNTIEVVSVKDYVDTKNILLAITENDFSTYRKLMPNSLIGYYDSIRTETMEFNNIEIEDICVDGNKKIGDGEKITPVS